MSDIPVGMDAGTSTIKCAAHSESGELLASRSRTNRYHTSPDGAANQSGVPIRTNGDGIVRRRGPMRGTPGTTAPWRKRSLDEREPLECGSRSIVAPWTRDGSHG